jgi:hypothetical protein
VRLTGVSAQVFSPAPAPDGAGQLPLFGGGGPAGGAAGAPGATAAAAAADRRVRLNAALDRIGDRFGRNTITTADIAAARADGDDGDPWRRR